MSVNNFPIGFFVGIVPRERELVFLFSAYFRVPVAVFSRWVSESEQWGATTNLIQVEPNTKSTTMEGKRTNKIQRSTIRIRYTWNNGKWKQQQKKNETEINRLKYPFHVPWVWLIGRKRGQVVWFNSGIARFGDLDSYGYWWFCFFSARSLVYVDFGVDGIRLLRLTTLRRKFTSYPRWQVFRYARWGRTSPLSELADRFSGQWRSGLHPRRGMIRPGLRRSQL